MHNLKMVTSGDKNYFKFLWRLEKNIYDKFGEYPIIYDLGLTEVQKSKLKSTIISIEVSSEYSNYNEDGFIKAIHKPNSILNFLENSSNNCLFLDADILFSRKVTVEDLDFKGVDLAVTPRHPEERYEKLFANGLINTGVMYFKNDAKTKGFIKLWMNRCLDNNSTDQLAMSNILTNDKINLFKTNYVEVEGIKVALLDAKKYNDVSLSDGLILHFKNAGRFEKAYQRYQVEYFIIQNSLPLRKVYNLLLKIKRMIKRQFKKKD